MRNTLCTIGAIGLLVGCAAPGVTHQPLDNAANRATPLSFGLFVTPDSDENPIDPRERFTGYHAALDYEVSSGELEGDVPVYAICSGEVVYSGFAEGYGGLVVHTCILNDEPVIVIYGHLDLEGLPPIHAEIAGGDTLGLLATAHSHESDGNRKHLHLGIRKGATLDIRGYVQNERDLEDFINPADVLPPAVIDLPGQSPGETPYWMQENGSGSVSS